MDPKTGLYSKAAQVIRKLPQQRATANEFIAMAKNKFGLKEAELKNAGSLPEGPIDRELLAQIFEARQPNILVSQYGENPSYLTPEQEKALRDLSWKKSDPKQKNTFSPEDLTRLRELEKLKSYEPNVIQASERDYDYDGEDDYISGFDEPQLVPEETQYSGYTSKGTNNYRERLLTMPSQYVSDGDLGYHENHPVTKAERAAETAMRMLQRDENAYGYDHPVTQQSRENFNRHSEELSRLKTLLGESPRAKEDYHSSHWSDHHNVLAHIRMSDRMVGEDRESVQPILERLAKMVGSDVGDLGSGSIQAGLSNGTITPEEAASVTRLLGWRNSPHYDKKGIGKRLLHVEELQSDWAQEGRDKGFRTKPFRVWDKKTGKTVSEHDTHDAAWDAYRTHPDSDKLDYGHNNAPSPAPYVTNTQHWTDLALKNVLREAALGGYDGIIFPSGQNQADRYGLDKFVDEVHYEPETKTFYANSGIGNPRRLIEKENVEPEQLSALVGRDVAEKLLDPANQYQHQNTIRSTVSQDDLKVSATGMKGYYDSIVPKSAMNLARQHDPEIKPAEPISYSEGKSEYSGFHLPMTDKLRQGILNEGFPAMRRGGRVDAALNLTRRFTKDGKGATMGLGVKE